MFPSGQGLPLLGRLRILEVYEFQDEPVLFAAIGDAGVVYLINLLDVDDDNYQWLAAPLSLGRFENVRTGKIELRRAFTQTEEGHVFILSHHGSRMPDDGVQQVPCSNLDDDQLPLTGERLRVGMPALPDDVPDAHDDVMTELRRLEE